MKINKLNFLFAVVNVKRIWKSLKETFAKKLASIPVKRSGAKANDDGDQCDWLFFQSLLFLKDQFTPRYTSGNLSTEDISSEILENSIQDLTHDLQLNTIEELEENIYQLQKVPSNSADT